MSSMNNEQLQHLIEAALMVYGKPMSIEKMMQLFEEDKKPTTAELKQALSNLSDHYQTRGIELKEVASGFRFQAKQDFAEWISRLWEEKAPKYSRALLETIALIAYRQPITRSEIEDVRGVSVSSHIVKTLLEREWVRVVGYRDVPGRPALYATTKEFLDYFDLKNLEDLPTLSEIRDLDKINAELDLGGENDSSQVQSETSTNDNEEVIDNTPEAVKEDSVDEGSVTEGSVTEGSVTESMDSTGESTTDSKGFESLSDEETSEELGEHGADSSDSDEDIEEMTDEMLVEHVDLEKTEDKSADSATFNDAFEPKSIEQELSDEQGSESAADQPVDKS